MDEMLALSATLPEVTCPAGAELIREGVPHGRLFVLVDGELEVVRGGTRIMVVDAPGAIFGEIAVLLGVPPTATVRALRDSRLRRCDDPDAFLTGDPRAARAVAVRLARRLDAMSAYLADLRGQYADHDNLGMVDTVLESLRHHQVHGVAPGSDREPDAPY